MQCLLPVLMSSGVQVMHPGVVISGRLTGHLRLPAELFDRLFHLMQGLFLFGESGAGCLQPAGKPLDFLFFVFFFCHPLGPVLNPVE